MRRISLTLLLALVVVVYGVGLAQGKKATPDSRPGDQPYTPTKLDWAAVELQAGYGQNSWTTEVPVMIRFVPGTDGRTIICLLQYTPEVSAQVVKINRDATRKVFSKYAETYGWDWLRLEFQEQVLQH